MALLSVKITDFRCLASADVRLDPVANLIVGPNAAGKTSVLEAIAYLGRGRSFRGASVDKVVRHGRKECVVFGIVEKAGGKHKLGVRNSREGLEISVDGDLSGGAASLAAQLPLQVIDPDVHNLVAGGPDERRRYLDWLGFHVEQPYLDLWRTFRRALRQRNAVLKDRPRPAELDVWDRELALAGERLDSVRAGLFEVLRPILEETASELVQSQIEFAYRRGWAEDATLGEVLGKNRERDVAAGSTGSGPQRADIALRYDERQARKLVSRGQQKLLACGMILAGVEVVQEALGDPLTLLLDDPAAELDRDSLARLMRSVERLGCQVVATSLNAEIDIFATDPAVFHVERGVVSGSERRSEA